MKIDPGNVEALRRLLKHPSNCGISSAHPAMEDPAHWCVGPVLRHRDSNLLAESNYEALLKRLGEKPELASEWEEHRFGHWAVGWVDHLSFKVFNEDGTPSAITKFLAEWFNALSDYPVADDDDLSEKVHNATIDNIEGAGSHMVRDDAPDGWPSRVYEWLAEHDEREVEDTDFQGAYPSDKAVKTALEELDLYEGENDDTE